MSATTTTATPHADTEDDWELDVSIAASGPVIAELLRSTDDNCGGTCASACTSCRS
jgi:FxLD family lantipeptide